MKTKMIRVAFVAAIAMVSGINFFKAQNFMNLSKTALANVEALASVEGYVLVERLENSETSSSKSVKNVLYTDMGVEYKCIDDRLHRIYQLRVDCFDEGSLPCREGYYQKDEPTNSICKLV